MHPSLLPALRRDQFSGNQLAGVAADEIERLQAAKRRALTIADERGKEAVELRAENERLLAALDIARTVLLNIERKSEEARASLTRVHER